MKPNLIIIITVIFCFWNQLDGQSLNQRNWQWVKQLGGPAWNQCSGIVIDDKDKLYITGSFSQMVSSDARSLNSSGNSDIFLASFNVKGDIINLWNYGGKGFDQAFCFTVGLNNAVILGGTITDTVNFGKQKLPGTGTRLFVSSTDNQGYVGWVTPIETIGNASLFLITSDRKGTIYAAGVFSGSLSYKDKKIKSNGQNDIFLLRMTSSGIIDQLISFGSVDEDAPSSLLVDKNGDVFLAGSFSRTFTIGQLTVKPEKGKTNLFLLKFDKLFTPQYVKVFAGEDYGHITCIKSDELNNLYVVGNFNLNINLQDTTFTSLGFTDAFIIKYNSIGEYVWGKHYGSDYYDYITGLDLDNTGGILLTGSIGGDIKMDSLLIHPTTLGDAAFVAQIDGNGKTRWSDFISGEGRNFSCGSVLDKKGNLYYCGSFQKSFNKDAGILKSIGAQDIFIARYYNCPETKLVFEGNLAICPGTHRELSVKNTYNTIVWNDTITNMNYLEVYKPGKYWVNIVDKKGCHFSDTVYITDALHPSFSLGKDTSILIVDSMVLKAPIIFKEYRWMDESVSPEFIAKSKNYKASTTKYWISYKDSMDCTWGDTIAIQYVAPPDISNYMHLKLITYPNPVSDVLIWKLDVDKACRFTIELDDNNGRIIHSETIDNYSPGSENRIQTSSQPNGTFILRVKNSLTGKVYDSRTIVKQ